MAEILIIDDDVSLCSTLAKMIGRLGHDVVSAHTLADGLGVAAAASVDLVFLDVGLPDGSGLEAIARIREIPGAPEVIIITALGEPDGAEFAIRSGAWDYLQKPFTQKTSPCRSAAPCSIANRNRPPKPPFCWKRGGSSENAAR